MAEPNMRTVTAAGIDLIVVELCDRRQGLGDPLLEWCFQSELENYLYSNWQTRGSFFKLLSRAGADGQSLCLRRKAVDEGLVTDAEFIGMRNAINRAARVFTVVPLAGRQLVWASRGGLAACGASARGGAGELAQLAQLAPAPPRPSRACQPSWTVQPERGLCNQNPRGLIGATREARSHGEASIGSTRL